MFPHGDHLTVNARQSLASKGATMDSEITGQGGQRRLIPPVHGHVAIRPVLAEPLHTMDDPVTKGLNEGSEGGFNHARLCRCDILKKRGLVIAMKRMTKRGITGNCRRKLPRLFGQKTPLA